MADYGRMGQGAMQYGQMGYQMGGAYGAVAGAVIGAALGYAQGDQVKKTFNRFNDMVLKNAATEMFDTRRQQNQLNRSMSMALSQYTSQKEMAQASFTSTFGASDMIGGSTEALSQVMDYQTEQAKFESMNNWVVGIDDYNTRLEGIRQNAMARFKRSEDGNYGLDYSALAKQGADWYSSRKGSGFQGMTDFSQFGTAGKSGSNMGSSMGDMGGGSWMNMGSSFG